MKLETAQRVLALLEFYFYTGHCYRQEVTGRRLRGGKSFVVVDVTVQAPWVRTLPIVRWWCVTE